jgi:Uncharacterized protein conserved in bacteria (DUF2188)/TIR domain
MAEKFDVALSYAGVDRPIARRITDALLKKGLRVFFDEYAESELWGRNLYDHLQRIYEDSRLCIVILSENYRDSQWATSEFRNLMAHSRLRDSFTILPVVVGKAPSGILSTLAYLDWEKAGPNEIADAVEKRLESLPPPTEKTERQNYHVIKRDSGWSVKRSGASRATSIHKTQEEAIAAAREIATRHRPSELIIHRQDGTILTKEAIESE